MKNAAFNQSSEGVESIFLLESYLEQAQIQNDFEQGEDPDEIRSIITTMEAICKQNDVSSNFVTQANLVLALDVFAKNERKITRDDVNVEPGDDEHKIQVKRFAIISKLPLQLLEQAYVDTLKQTSTAELA